MTPVAIGGLAGRFHHGSGRCAVLVVPAFGVEALAAGRFYRLLAEGLAARGHPTLIIDPSGAGQSVERTGELVATWTNDVAMAAERLAAWTAGPVAILGHRLGGLAASLAATTAGAHHLILLDPIISGRLHARELAMTARALTESVGLDPTVTSDANGLEIAGFGIDAASLKGLKAVDLSRLPVPACTKTIIHGAACNREQSALAAAWAGATLVAACDLDGVGSNPTTARSAPATIAAIAHALAEEGPIPETGTPARLGVPARIEGGGFIEEQITFGDEGALYGVLCRPSGTRPTKTVVIVNAGRNPCAGWARSSVALARDYSRQGVASLRFDGAGLGDSRDRAGQGDELADYLYTDAAGSDVRAALNALGARGLDNVVLQGACSGAYTAFRVAADDDRVVGLILVNCQRFVWRGSETIEEALRTTYPSGSAFAARALSLAAWRRVLSGERSLLPALSALAGRVRGVVNLVLPSASTRAVRRAMRAVAKRGPVMLIYSAGDAGLAELSRHFAPGGRLLPAGVDVAIVDDADHDMTPRAAREAVAKILINALTRGHRSPSTAARV